MNIEFTKKHINAKTPVRAHDNDSGYDVTAAEDALVIRDTSGYISFLSYDTGIIVSPPENIYFLLYPRSSIRKYDLSLSNSVGVIDTSYRGNILVCFTPTIYTRKLDDLKVYDCGDRIAQLIPQIRLDITLKESDLIGSSERGSKGFGSSGT